MSERSPALAAPRPGEVAAVLAAHEEGPSLVERLRTGAALATWTARVAPELVATTARTWSNPRTARERLAGRSRTAKAFADALRTDLGATFRSRNASWASRVVTTVHRATAISRFRVGHAIQYGPHHGQELEIWRSEDVDVSARSAPVLVFVPGGGWVHGRAVGQGHALMGRLAAHGWICVAVNYRVAPTHPWPAHIEDVNRALAWTREHIGLFGGSQDFIAVAGASAGGHLATLAALTSDSDRWKQGFEGADTHVDAVISLYGRYDWEKRDTEERRRFMRFLERVVVGTDQILEADLFAEASPIARVRADAPPFFVIHGDSDAIIPVAQAQQFVEALRAVSTSPTVYAELPGAGHAFDVVDPYRAAITAKAVETFMAAVR